VFQTVATSLGKVQSCSRAVLRSDPSQQVLYTGMRLAIKSLLELHSHTTSREQRLSKCPLGLNICSYSLHSHLLHIRNLSMKRNRLGVNGNRVLRRISTHKRQGLTSGRRNFHSEELHICILHQIL